VALDNLRFTPEAEVTVTRREVSWVPATVARSRRLAFSGGIQMQKPRPALIEKSRAIRRHAGRRRVRESDLRLAGLAVAEQAQDGPVTREFFCCQMPNRFAILTRAASDLASIFRMALPRCTLTVISETPSLAAICLFISPAVTRGNTSFSRAVSVS
jgi:hypothetical protein